MRAASAGHHRNRALAATREAAPPVEVVLDGEQVPGGPRDGIDIHDAVVAVPLGVLADRAGFPVEQRDSGERGFRDSLLESWHAVGDLVYAFTQDAGIDLGSGAQNVV